MRFARMLLPLLALIALPAAAATVPDSAEGTKPLPVGAAAPAFTVRTLEGADWRFDPARLKSPVILIFYRGGWCPYCNAHLAALRKAEAELGQLGYEVLFLSADRPEALQSSLKEPAPGYTLLSDARLQAARAFGLAFKVDEATVSRYKSMGIDLEAASGETHHQLPVPAVYLIDRSGKIRFMYANPDYRVRLSAEELLAAARKHGG